MIVIGAALAGNVQLETFDHVSDRIPAVHPDPIEGWTAQVAKLRKAAKKAKSAEQLRPTLRTLIESLGESHFAVMGPSTEPVPMGLGLLAGGTTGASIAGTSEGVVVWRVEPGSPAEQAGVVVGDRVLSIGDHAMTPLHAEVYLADPSGLGDLVLRARAHSWLDGPAGGSVVLTLAPDRKLTVSRTGTGVYQIAAVGEMPAMAAVWSDRSVPFSAEGSARVVRLDIFSAPAMLQFIGAMDRARAEDDAVILDLRGNPGGVIQVGRGVAGFFIDERGSLGTMRTKTATLELVTHPRPKSQRFAGRLALLVDGASGSTSEILASAFQETGRARIFGTQTAGMALPSMFETLPNGDTLQLAIGDLHTPAGARVEGIGVTPDVVVPLTPATLAARADPVMAAALAWLAEESP